MAKCKLKDRGGKRVRDEENPSIEFPPTKRIRYEKFEELIDRTVRDSKENPVFPHSKNVVKKFGGFKPFFVDFVYLTDASLPIVNVFKEEFEASMDLQIKEALSKISQCEFERDDGKCTVSRKRELNREIKLLGARIEGFKNLFKIKTVKTEPSENADLAFVFEDLEETNFDELKMLYPKSRKFAKITGGNSVWVFYSDQKPIQHYVAEDRFPTGVALFDKNKKIGVRLTTYISPKDNLDKGVLKLSKEKYRTIHDMSVLLDLAVREKVKNSFPSRYKALLAGSALAAAGVYILFGLGYLVQYGIV